MKRDSYIVKINKYSKEILYKLNWGKYKAPMQV
jgi:hypothetical protein